MSDENIFEDNILEEDILEDEFIIDEKKLGNPTTEEVKQVLEEIKIEITPEDKEKYKKNKPGRKPGVKKDIPTPEELDGMSDEEVEVTAEDEIKDLYLEFSSFMEDKAKIKSDDGIKETIPTGIDVLDAAMGGGFAIGTLSMIAGNPGCGKSMLAIQAMASAQRKYLKNTLVGYLDSEEATTTIRMSNLGVRNPRIKPYTDITVEKVFKFIEGLCLYKELKGYMDQPSVIIWDSIANTLSQKEREVEDINSALGYKARMLSVLIPKYVSKLSIYNICLIAVNQLRDTISIGPFSSPKELNFMRQGKTIPGGNTLRYNAFHLLEMKVKSVVDIEKFGFDGIVCEVKCVKNKLFPPNIPINIVGNFISGFDNFWTNYLYLIENKRLTSAAWCYLNSLPNMKFRTKEAKDLYLKDQTFKMAFDETVKETIKIELIDKNTYLI